MMKRFVILGLKILGGLLAVVIVLLLVATLVLNSHSFQQKMLSHATELTSADAAGGTFSRQS